MSYFRNVELDGVWKKGGTYTFEFYFYSDRNSDNTTTKAALTLSVTEGGFVEECVFTQEYIDSWIAEYPDVTPLAEAIGASNVISSTDDGIEWGAGIEEGWVTVTVKVPEDANAGSYILFWQYLNHIPWPADYWEIKSSEIYPITIDAEGSGNGEEEMIPEDGSWPDIEPEGEDSEGTTPDEEVEGGVEYVALRQRKQQIVWFSKTGDYDNFSEGVEDDDAFWIVVPTMNNIRWVEAIESLLVGTSGDEWLIKSNKLDTPITPTNVSIKQQSNYGSSMVQPIRVNDVILFIDYVGRKVRELVYREYPEGKYVSPDLTSLAEHITLSGITSIAHQRNPDSILWLTLSDGSLISMTYEREQNVVAWSKHPLGGDATVLSVCVVPSVKEDKVWLSAQRLIDEADVTHIERMMSRNFADIEDAYFADAGIVYDSDGTSTITELNHLEGETVKVFGDGVEFDDATVASGQITTKLDGVETLVSKAAVGLSYTYKLEPMRIDVDVQGGTTHGSIKKIHELVISFLRTAGAYYGKDANNLYDAGWTAGELFTGDKIVTFDAGFDVRDKMLITGSGSLPCTIRAIVARMTKSGR